MKALTLTQPWATLVAIGAKRIETRSWNTNYRGPLAIHAAKGPDKTGVVVTIPFWSTLKGAGINPLELPHGFVVATCELVHVFPMTELLGFPFQDDATTKKMFEIRIEHSPTINCLGREWPLNYYERAFGDYAPDRYAWLLA